MGNSEYIEKNESIDKLAENSALMLLNIASHSVAKKGSFTVALSGGSACEILCRGLREVLNDNVDTENWHFFWADERCVPLDDERSNFFLAKKLLFDQFQFNEDNIHPVANLPAREAANGYEQLIRDFFEISSSTPARFDLIVLGIGQDCHTASLFAESPLLDEDRRLIAPVLDSPKPPKERVTFTLPLINDAKNIVFIASGEKKLEAIEKITSLKTPDRRMPASFVRPKNGTRKWLIKA